MAGVTIDFNKNAIGAKLKKAADKSVAPLMEQVLKDSNYFCRQDQSTLIASSQIASRPADGVLIWDTPYARRTYYTGTPSKDINANASLMWFHKAKNQFGSQWQTLAQKLFNKEV